MSDDLQKRIKELEAENAQLKQRIRANDLEYVRMEVMREATRLRLDNAHVVVGSGGGPPATDVSLFFGQDPNQHQFAHGTPSVVMDALLVAKSADEFRTICRDRGLLRPREHERG